MISSKRDGTEGFADRNAGGTEDAEVLTANSEVQAEDLEAGHASNQ
jgi:hypothetical protein